MVRQDFNLDVQRLQPARRIGRQEENKDVMLRCVLELHFSSDEARCVSG